jgi:hypothetical protein
MSSKAQARRERLAVAEKWRNIRKLKARVKVLTSPDYICGYLPTDWYVAMWQGQFTEFRRVLMKMAGASDEQIAEWERER